MDNHLTNLRFKYNKVADAVNKLHPSKPVEKIKFSNFIHHICNIQQALQNKKMNSYYLLTTSIMNLQLNNTSARRV